MLCHMQGNFKRINIANNTDKTTNSVLKEFSHEMLERNASYRTTVLKKQIEQLYKN